MQCLRPNYEFPGQRNFRYLGVLLQCSSIEQGANDNNIMRASKIIRPEKKKLVTIFNGPSLDKEPSDCDKTFKKNIP